MDRVIFLATTTKLDPNNFSYRAACDMKDLQAIEPYAVEPQTLGRFRQIYGLVFLSHGGITILRGKVDRGLEVGRVDGPIEF